jgi:hypothetical protein
MVNVVPMLLNDIFGGSALAFNTIPFLYHVTVARGTAIVLHEMFAVPFTV